MLLVTAFSSTIPLLALFDMRRLSNRHANRRLCIAFLLVLAVVAFLRSWRQVALELPSSNGDVSISTSGGEIESSACEWQQGGPQLYMLQHTKKHPKGENKRSKQCRLHADTQRAVSCGQVHGSPRSVRHEDYRRRMLVRIYQLVFTNRVKQA